mmetsp:Transcript_7685/g.17694  ORF Transcript_7685/g.17694 Transcript_7685/m.17694 type:complete len:269 (-) Transcript_7685:7-813(-)
MLHRNLPSQDLAHGAEVLFVLGSLLRHAPLEFVGTALFCSLHPLNLLQLRIAALFEVFLVPLQRSQLFLLQHFHHALLQSLSHEDLQYRLALYIKVEELPILDLSLNVDADLRRHEQRGRRAIEDEVGLGLCLKLHDSVCQLFEIRIRLHVEVFATWHWLGSPRALLRLVRALQASPLRFPLLLHLRHVWLRLHHRCIGVASDHPPVVHDIAIGFGPSVIGITVLVSSTHCLWGRRELLHLSRLHDGGLCSSNEGAETPPRKGQKERL